MIIAVSLYLSQAKPAPFIEEINAFVKADREKPPAKGQILFVGSSSFRGWRDVQNYFPKHQILNRGFGGSSLPHVELYAEQIIFPYEPKQIVIYCGENDISSEPKMPSYVVYERFVSLFTKIRKRMPDVPIAYVGNKPSPSRWHLRAKNIASNRFIEQFLLRQRKTSYINVWDAMLGPDGRPLPEIFLKDELHMNAKGYKIWAPIIEKHLID